MLKIKLVPYERLEGKMGSIMKDLHDNTIVIIDAKLSAKEEAVLIAETMRGVSDKFSGIELSSMDIHQGAKMGKLGKVRNAFVERIIGKKRGITIVGPAKVVQRIKKNPEEILIHIGKG